jgi:hypothetical protein
VTVELKQQPGLRLKYRVTKQSLFFSLLLFGQCHTAVTGEEAHLLLHFVNEKQLKPKRNLFQKEEVGRLYNGSLLFGFQMRIISEIFFFVLFEIIWRLARCVIFFHDAILLFLF